MKTKHLTGVKIVDEEKGEVSIVFATFNVKDHDGDVTFKEAFEEGAELLVSQFGHKIWNGAPPVGKGYIEVTDTKAIAHVKFFLDTQAGLETFRTIKGTGDLQEWSYGYDVLDSEHGNFKGERVQFLKRLKVHEVSPVMLGAGIDTETISAKGLKQLACDVWGELEYAGRERFGRYTYVDDFDVDESYAVFAIWDDVEYEYGYLRVPFTRDAEGNVTLGDDETPVIRTPGYRAKSSNLKFSEHADTVLADVDALIARAAEVKAMRLAKGKDVGETATRLLTEISAKSDRLREVMASEPSAQDTKADLTRELARFEGRRASQGVPA